MNEKELIIEIRKALDPALSVPIKTSGLEDERPVPAVIIDDWRTDDKNFNNSAFGGEELTDPDNDGNLEYKRHFNFSFDTRVTFAVRDDDEVDVMDIQQALVRNLRLIGENPQAFHDDLKDAQVTNSGEPSYTFTEAKETEMMVRALFKADDRITVTPSDSQHDTIETVNDQFTFNP